MKDSSTPPQVPYALIVSGDRLQSIRRFALERTFGCVGLQEDAVRHGYLLALEEIASENFDPN